MNKILIVEDDPSIAIGLEDNLKMAGFHAVVARDGEEALEKVKKEKPDLIILDIMLPRINGLDVCRKLKEQGSRVPIIILSALGQESDKVRGLELGADDYVTKPFSVKELLSRVKAVLRRSLSAPEKPEIYRVGRLELDCSRVTTSVKGKPAELTSREFELLKALILAGGKMLSRAALLEKAWGVDSSLEVETRTVDVHIATLRKKLGSEGHRIVTVKNYGYRFETGNK